LAGHLLAGGVIGEDDLADGLDLPRRSVAQLVTHLEQAGLIHRVQSETGDVGGLTLALPPGQILMAQLVELAHGLTVRNCAQGQDSAWSIVEKWASAQRQAAGDMTLADLL